MSWESDRASEICSLLSDRFSAINRTSGSVESVSIRCKPCCAPALLGTARAGCTAGNVVVNHLQFADDLCVFGPSVVCLQCLLISAYDSAGDYEIVSTCNKAFGAVFSPKSLNNLQNPLFP